MTPSKIQQAALAELRARQADSAPSGEYDVSALLVQIAQLREGARYALERLRDPADELQFAAMTAESVLEEALAETRPERPVHCGVETSEGTLSVHEGIYLYSSAPNSTVWHRLTPECARDLGLALLAHAEDPK